jgi:hypothetical protein
MVAGKIGGKMRKKWEVFESYAFANPGLGAVQSWAAVRAAFMGDEKAAREEYERWEADTARRYGAVPCPLVK